MKKVMCSEYEKRLVRCCVIIACMIAIALHISIMETEKEKMFSVIFGYFYAGSFGLIYIIYMWLNNKMIRIYEKNKIYYKTKFVSGNLVKRFKNTHLPSWGIYVVIIYGICVVVMASFSVWGDSLKEVFENIHSDIWNVEERSTTVTIVLAGYGVVLALIPIVREYLNKKCMFFDVDDLPEIKRNVFLIISVTVGIVIWSVLLLTLNEQYMWVIGALELVVGILFVVIILLYLLCWVKPIRWEKGVIDTIDKLYDKRNAYILIDKTWKQSKVIRIMTKLLKDYEKSLRGIHLSKIESIRFGFVMQKNEDNLVLTRRYSKVVLVSMLVWYSLLCGVMNNEPCIDDLYGKVLVIVFIPALASCISHEWKEKNFRFVNNLMYTSWWGYYVYEKEKKVKYISAYDGRKTKYGKFILNIKKVVSFYNLAISMEYEEKNEFNRIDCMCDYVYDLVRDNKDITAFLIPIFICSCIWKEEGYSDRIKELIKEVYITEEEKEKLINICMQMIRDIYGDDRKFVSEDYFEELENLFA